MSVSKRIQWHLETWDIDKLVPYEKNPRIIRDDKLEELERSFNNIGMAQPININLDGTILSGHARWMQLKKEGASTVDVYVPDRELTPKQEEAVIILMNKAVAGEWDFQMLNLEFEKSDLMDWGFLDSDLNFQLSDASIEDVRDHDQSEQEEKYIIEVQFPNEMEMRDIYDDLVPRGYLVKIKGLTKK